MQNYFNIRFRKAIFYYTVKYYDGHFEIIATKKDTNEIINTLNRSSKRFYLNSIAWIGTYLVISKDYLRIAEPRIINF